MKDVARLAALALALALAISRFGLVVHELVGHGVMAIALGGEVAAWSLHWFGGGWLGFTPPRGDPGALYLVDMGGIVVETVLAAGCALAARRARTTLRLALAGAAWAFAIHAGWYLAAGTYHGFGDGWLLHQRLGADRLFLVIPVGVAIVVAGWRAGAGVGTALRAYLPGGRLGGAAAALALALGVHAALTVGEMRLHPDRPYQMTMRTAAQRAVERELALQMARAQAEGAPMDARAVAVARRDLERQHRQFPLGPLLIGAIGVAAAVGVARSRAPAEPTALPARTLALAGAVAAASIVLVAVLDRLSP